jgi:hypothetical protein
MTLCRFAWSLAAVALVSGIARAQVGEADLNVPAAPAPPATGASVLTSLRTTLDTLGATSGVPDGLGASYYPAQSARGQPGWVSIANWQAGLTLPVYDTATDSVIVTSALQVLTIRGHAVLPDDRARVPPRLWTIQGGGGYVRQTEGDWTWGLTLVGGTASDQPFDTVREDTLSALAFLRVPRCDRDAWLFYVVSTSNGQLGQNIPVPGVAYEFNRDQFHGVVGFPFFNVTYRPLSFLEWELSYAAMTDVQARVNYLPVESAKLFTGFAWANQSWFRAERADRREQLFSYEKRIETGLSWQLGAWANIQILSGWAFDRYFTETSGFSLHGRNRVDIGAGPFFTTQLEVKY